MTIQQQTLFVFGLGYSAMALARRLNVDGWRIIGTRRSAAGVAEIEAGGLEGVVFDGSAAVPVPPGAHWVISVPPGEDGCRVVRAVGDLAGDAASVTYLSTTGVYGDLKGGWAFEGSSVQPGSQRAARRAEAEAQWLNLRPDVRLVRLPGIYGPGRSPFDRLRAGSATRIVKPGQVFSRVHVDDIASGLEALLARPTLDGVFHLCDDEPAPPQDVTAFAASLLGVEPPPEIVFETAELSAMAKSFYAECKRVSNAATKARLGWRPEFPTYREGLRAELAQDRA